MSEKFANVLKMLRTEKKLSQTDLAKELCISQRAYAHYEKNESEPSLETLIKIADFYNVSLDYLTGRYT